MPLTGFLKIDDIKGESQLAEETEKFRQELSDEADALLVALAETRGSEDAEFKFSDVRISNASKASKDVSLNFAKIEMRYIDETKDVEVFAQEYEDALLAQLGAVGSSAVPKVSIQTKGGETYLKITMKDVLVTSVSTGGSGGEDRAFDDGDFLLS